MPKRECSYPSCTTLVDTKQGSRCTVHNPHKLYDKTQRDDTWKFYRTREWKRIRDVRLKMDNHMCVRCRDQGVMRQAQMVDHIKPIKTHWQLRLSLSNLQSLCFSCHNYKTSNEDPRGS